MAEHFLDKLADEAGAITPEQNEQMRAQSIRAPEQDPPRPLRPNIALLGFNWEDLGEDDMFTSR